MNQFKYLGSTQTKEENSVKELTIRLTQTHSVMTILAILWNNKAICFPTKIILYRSLVLSVLHYGCDSWILTADLERQIQDFENLSFATEGCLTYHTERIKGANALGSMPIVSLPDLRNVCGQPSSVAICHGSPMYVAMIRCRRSYNRAPWTERVVEVDHVSRGRRISRNGRATPCHLCSALQKPGADGRSSQRRHLSGNPSTPGRRGFWLIERMPSASNYSQRWQIAKRLRCR